MSNRRITPKTNSKPPIILSRWGVFGWLLSFVVLSGCMFVIGVIIGRNSVPVFDMDAIDAKMVRLKKSSMAEIEKKIEIAKQQKDHYLEVAKNIDIFESLKEKGKGLFTYKQYVPPVKMPKYNKKDKPEDVSAEADEKLIRDQEMRLASAQPVDAGSQGNPTETQAPEMTEAEDASQSPDTSAEVKASQVQPESGPAIEKPQPEVKPAEGPAEEIEEAIDIKEDAKPEAKPEEKPVESPPEIKTPEQPAIAQQEVNQAASAMEETGKNKETDIDQEVKLQPSDKQYTIQVASLKELDKANIVKDKFRKKGYPAYCQSTPVRGEMWHRVRIGPYPDRKIAESDCARLKEAGFDVVLFVMDGK